MLKTNTGRMLMIDDDDNEDDDDNRITKDINLSDNGEALVGFKGSHGQYIDSLAIYKASRQDVSKPKKK